MYKLSLVLLLPFTVSATWFEPGQSRGDEPARAEMPRIMEVSAGDPLLPGRPGRSAGKHASPAASLELSLGEVASATVGVPVTLNITIRNNAAEASRGLLLGASFDAQLQHDTRANPVELPLPTLKSSEEKTIPLVLTPTRAGNHEIKVFLSADGQERRDASLSFNANEQVAAQQRPAPSSEAHGIQPAYGQALAPGYSENLWNARSHVFTFVHAEAEGRNIKVSDLRVEYVARTYQSKAADGTARVGSYFEPVTREDFRSIPATKIRAMRADAKRLDGNELLKALKGSTPVVVFRDGETLDPFVLSMFKPETLILVLPPRPQGPATLAPPRLAPVAEKAQTEISSK
jgi:hypothetical protein